MKPYIEFPHMGIKLNIDRIAFEICGIPVYWYGIIIGLGVVLGTMLASYIGKTKDLPKDTIVDIVLFGLPVSVICARLYYVIFEWEYYSKYPAEIFNIRNGGIAIYGAVIGGLLTALVYCKVKKISFTRVADSACFGLLTGQILGRWGNFFNQEAFGCNTDLPWGMSGSEIVSKLEKLSSSGIDVIASQPVHPTFLYESLWNIAVIITVFIIYKRKHLFDGIEFYSYISLYGLGRIWIEGLRTDSLMLGSIRISQLVAVCCVVFGIILIIFNLNKSKKITNFEKNIEFSNQKE